MQYIFSQKTPYTTPLRARYGVYFVGSSSNWHCVSVPAGRVNSTHFFTSINPEVSVKQMVWQTAMLQEYWIMGSAAISRGLMDCKETRMLFLNEKFILFWYAHYSSGISHHYIVCCFPCQAITWTNVNQYIYIFDMNWKMYQFIITGASLRANELKQNRIL